MGWPLGPPRLGGLGHRVGALTVEILFSSHCLRGPEDLVTFVHHLNLMTALIEDRHSLHLHSPYWRVRAWGSVTLGAELMRGLINIGSRMRASSSYFLGWSSCPVLWK